MQRLIVCTLLFFTAACASSIDDIGFTGPGQLAVIVERAETERRIWVYEPGGRWTAPIEQPQELRFASPRKLVVSSRTPNAFQVACLNLDSRSLEAVGEPGHYFQLEPSPDGRWLAVSSETALEIWRLDATAERMATRVSYALDEPRWAPDPGRGLVVARPTKPRETHFGSIAIPWPRLYRMPRDLTGSLERVSDQLGEIEEPPGGSYPLWWDASGVFARQREGLVRCDPGGSGCALLYATPNARVIDARPFGATHALVLIEREAGSNELLDVELGTGGARRVWLVPPNLRIIDLDWSR